MEVYPVFPFQSVEKMAEKHYDVLIVGTGAGGAAVLWRLCQKWRKRRKKIGIIEAGDHLLSSHVYDIPRLRAKWKTYYGKVVTPVGKRLPQFSGAEQVFAVGGRTLFWGAVTPRMHDSETSHWPLSKMELDIYYRIAEEVMQIGKSSASASIQVQEHLDLLHAKGFRRAMPIPYAISNGQTVSSITFLKKAREYRPFDFAVSARALQLLLQDGKPIGLKAAGPDRNIHVLKANTIVLAAGALETPRLLLHSGISGRAIGHFLTNHSFIKAKGTYSRNPPSDLNEQIPIILPQSDTTPYQLQLYINRSSIRAVGFGKVESAFHNKLALDRNRVDEYGVPHIKVVFSYSEKDFRVIRRMKRAMVQVFQALGAKVAGRNRKPQIHLMKPGADYHESGTCRIGNHPSDSAANSYGQIHGVPGLYAADNSILPSIGAANPTLTTIALAIRTADHISHSR